MKIRIGILRRFAALTLVGLAAQVACRAELISFNTITNDANKIGLRFDPAVTLPSATNLANYTVLMKTGAVSITSVTLQTNSELVEVNLAVPIGEFFALAVSNVVDVATNDNNFFDVGCYSDYASSRIGVAGNPNPTGHVFTVQASVFEVTVGGSGVGGTNDFCHFVHGQVVSNFDMSVMVERLDQASDVSKAGLMARESLSPGSRMIQTSFTPPGGTNEIQSTMRTTLNGVATSSGFQVGGPPSATPLRWLRLTRTNNTFTAYHGTNGADWSVSGVTTQAFSANLNIGMMASAHTTNGTATTAKFVNFRKQGARPGDGTLPTLSSTLTGGTNLNISWTRTPRDFAVEVSTNLTDWALLLIPIVQGGSNGTTYSMSVPLNLTSNLMFLRLARVDRVIPDAVFVLTTGIIISPAYGLSGTNVSGGFLCVPGTTPAPGPYSIPILGSLSYVQAAGQVVAPYGTPVTFSTANSDALVDTVLQVRTSAGQTFCNDNTGVSNKSVVVRSTTASSMTNYFSIIVAPRSSPAPGYTATSELRVKVSY